MAELILRVRPPFDLLATVRLLQRRPNNRVDLWTGEAYVRALCVGGAAFACTVTAERDLVHVAVAPRPSKATAAELAQALTRVLGLELPPGFGIPGSAAHPKLRALARRLRGARPPRFPSLFEALCRIIPYQQLSLEAGIAVTARFVERFGRPLPSPAGPLIAFPDAERLASSRRAEFEGIGLSGAKLAAIQELARLIARGALQEHELESLGSEAALQRLQELPGIGPWTAALVLLRGLGRMDVFPAGDVGAQRGLGELVGDRASIQAVIERAGARRGYLYFYALANGLQKRGLLRA